MIQSRRRLPEFFKHEAADQVLAVTQLRHVAEKPSVLGRYASSHEAGTDLFDYIRLYNHPHRHSTLAYLSSMECKRRYASSNS